MSKLDDIRNALKALMQGVAGIGTVHAYERYADRADDFKALFVQPDKTVKGWIIRRVSTREETPNLGRYVVTHTWRINGYQSFDDANMSEIAFDNLIEAVRDAVRADDTLGGVVATMNVDGAAGAQVDDSGPVMFARVLCHGVRMTVRTSHYQ